MFSRLNVQIAQRDGRAAGFIGTSRQPIEALFVNPSRHRRGIGRPWPDALTSADPRAAWTVDVNEHDPVAAGFHERHGFARIGRSERDAGGRPFPRLHLRLRR